MSRRVILLLAAGGVLVSGLAVHAGMRTDLGGVLGDILYAVLIYLLAAAVLVRARALAPGIVALVFCFGVELLQLAGPPPELALVLGSTFQAGDLLAYTAGVGLTAAVDTMLRRRTRSA